MDASELGVCTIPLGRSRFEFHASGRDLASRSDKLLEQLCSDLVKPRDLRLESLADGYHLSTRPQKLLKQVRPDAIETSNFLVGRCGGQGQTAES
jgi:hypothetical protein